MNEQESIFVPIEYERYKQNKILLLKMRLLEKNIKQRIDSLKLISEEKYKIKKVLERSLTNLKKEFLEFEKQMPESNEKRSKPEVIHHTYHPDSRFLKIDSELRQIQAKLNSLRDEK